MSVSNSIRGKTSPSSRSSTSDQTNLVESMSNLFISNSLQRQRDLEPCRAYKRGKCTAGARCKYSHEPPMSLDATLPNSPNPKRRYEVCRYFRENGRCKYGNGCKYSHDTNAVVSPGAHVINPGSNDQASTDATYRAWKKIVRQGFSSIAHERSPLNPNQIESFLNDGLKLLDNGSPGNRQDVMKELATEAGLSIMRQVLEAQFASGYTLTQLSFQRHCVPFLKLVSHKELRSSLIFENAVGTIYTFMYGIDGRRGIQFFRRVADNIRIKFDESIASDWVGEALCAAAATLNHVLSLNSAAIVQDELKDVLKTLCACYSPEKMKEYEAHSARADLQKIKERLHMGDTIRLAGAASKPAAAAPRNVSYGSPVDYPGELSPRGRRHDNDHAYIEDIKVLPTHDEIQQINRNEFLPTVDPLDPHHERGIRRVLDTNFRLLREDTSGLLRDAIQVLNMNWEAMVERRGKIPKGQERNDTIKTIVYQQLEFGGLNFNKTKGFEVEISFAQIHRVSNLKTKAERQNWWDSARHLQNGNLLALVGRNQNTTFLIVSERKVISSDKRDLASSSERAFIVLQLADPLSEHDQWRLISARAKGEPSSVLIEFPGQLFASFATVLKGLQHLHTQPNLPFLSYITVDASEVEVENGFVVVPPPLYLLRHRTLDLSGITKQSTPFNFSLGGLPTVESVHENTMLDRGQSQAFIAAMSRELALIQGPPGTGKSYLGVKIAKVLLDNRSKLNIGPIVCVCYTNHALDQFLELLINEGVTKIVRLGSRSNNELLKQMTLPLLTKDAERSRHEKQQIWECHQKLGEIVEDVGDLLSEFEDMGSWRVVKQHLKVHHHDHYQQLFGTFEETFEEDLGEEAPWERVVGSEAKVIDNWLRGHIPGRRYSLLRLNSDRPVEVLQKVLVYEMSMLEREKLKNYWEQEMLAMFREKMKEAVCEHNDAKRTLNFHRTELDRRCLQDSHVIGVTTTGLATQAELIRSVDARVLICEEAGEILEAHQLTSFLPSLEHAILIGDHQQLRPHIARYDLSMECVPGGLKYALDKSFFERLVNTSWPSGAKFPIATLDVQRRMHPSISELVRRCVPYPELKDHESTTEHPEVVGMGRKLFWLDHRNPENQDDKEEVMQGSKVNLFEVDFALALVRHLVRQGVYKAGEIAVITPYLGQLRELRRKLGRMFDVVLAEQDEEQLALEDDVNSEPDETSEGLRPLRPIQKLPSNAVEKTKLLSQVRVATVDNFQGEEAKVIVVSLVRSNKDRRCGFLKTSNRINVLLSRAKHGMYIIGNAETAIAKVRMWQEVVNILENGNNIGSQLELRCPRHKLLPIMVAQPDDFLRLSPEGGCNERCGLRLNCGHTCRSLCHAQHLHDAVQCLELCQKIYQPCLHACEKFCWQECGTCTVPVFNVGLPCGHTAAKLNCSQLQSLDKIRCQKKVMRIMPGCRHEVSVPCSASIESYKCPQICGDPQPCGHRCPKRCASCRKWDAEADTLRVEHGTCKIACDRNFTTCSHSCRNACHGGTPCEPCSLRCEVRCIHSRCGKKCNDPCAPCAEECSWSCVHNGPGIKCHMPCAVPCDMLPCSKRCESKLACGHQCPSLCGETCPKKEYCQVKDCGVDKILQQDAIDFIDMDLKYGEVNLEEDPIVVLTCGHFFTLTSLDGIMGLNDVYELDSRTGERIRPKSLPANPEGFKPKGCPNCRAPLRDIFRYNRLTKKSLLEEATRKFCVQAHEEYQKWETIVTNFGEECLPKARESIVLILKKDQASDSVGPKEDLFELFLAKWKVLLVETPNLEKFLRSVDEQSQPFGKVHDMVIAAKSRGNIGSFSGDDCTFQMSFYIRGLVLRIKLQWLLLLFIHTLYQDFNVQRNERIYEFLRKTTESTAKSLQKETLSVLEEAEKRKLSRHMLEARIYHVRAAAIELLHISRSTMQKPLTLRRKQLLEKVDDCERIVKSLPERITLGLQTEIDSTRRLIISEVFYEIVSEEEKRMLAEVMKKEFRGTGHWYTCVNGHGFTIGECGMPMELARCYECGERIGGQNHSAVAGVNLDRGMDSL